MSKVLSTWASMRVIWILPFLNWLQECPPDSIHPWWFMMIGEDNERKELVLCQPKLSFKNILSLFFLSLLLIRCNILLLWQANQSTNHHHHRYQQTLLTIIIWIDRETTRSNPGTAGFSNCLIVAQPQPFRFLFLLLMFPRSFHLISSTGRILVGPKTVPTKVKSSINSPRIEFIPTKLSAVDHRRV